MAKSKGPGDWDWEELDWLEEMPLDDLPAEEPRPAAKRPARQSAPQQPQRTAQQRATQRRPAASPRPSQPYPPQQQRPAQQRAPQQRAPQQQRVPQQRPPQQQRAPQQRAPQRSARPYPPQEDYYYEDQPVRRQSAPRRQSPPPQQQTWREQGYREYREVAVEPEDYRPRRRGFQKQNIPLIILVVLLIGGVLFAGGKLGSMLLNYHRDRSAYNALADEATSGLAEPNATTEPGATPDPNQNQQTASEAPFGVNWEYLQSTNPDVVGWLFCADTMINYPVVQTSDNDYYLHRGFDRQPNTAGALFADYNAAIGITNSNFIIYGHNMKDGSMFAAVEKYLDPNFYSQHPVMYFMTPNQNYRVELIACHIVESTIDNYPGYFGGDEYQQYLNNITSHSSFATRTAVTTNYQLITLSTCDYSGSYADPRCLLQGLLVPIT